MTSPASQLGTLSWAKRDTLKERKRLKKIASAGAAARWKKWRLDKKQKQRRTVKSG